MVHVIPFSYHIRIVGGTEEKLSFLSSSPTGIVSLGDRDDNSGCQRWLLKPVHGGELHTYNIVAGGKDLGNPLLSCTPTGAVIDLWSGDDGSGRQQWTLEPVAGGEPHSYNIRVAGGTIGGRELLSCSPGGFVDLWLHDDGSGRQRWVINKVSCDLAAKNQDSSVGRSQLQPTPDPALSPAETIAARRAQRKAEMSSRQVEAETDNLLHRPGSTQAAVQTYHGHTGRAVALLDPGRSAARTDLGAERPVARHGGSLDTAAATRHAEQSGGQAEPPRLLLSLSQLASSNRLFGKVDGSVGGAVTSTRIEYNNKGLVDEDAMVVAEVIKASTSLTELFLSNNSIGDAGAKALAEALITRPPGTLKILGLVGNASINAAGTVALARSLSRSPPLKAIYLSGAAVGDTGAVAFSEALVTNSNLATLGLQACGIGGGGGRALARALPRNEGLRELHLADNPLVQMSETREAIHVASTSERDIAIRVFFITGISETELRTPVPVVDQMSCVVT